MAIHIGNNVTSLNAQRALATSQRNAESTLGRLSTGKKLTFAADDAAGMAVSERLQARLRSLSQAERNASDGSSMLQTAESGLGSIGESLGRMRELAIQAANGTLNSTERGNVQEEFSQLRSEIDRVAQTTEFNGKHLLNGSAQSVALQIGSGSSSGDTVNVELENVGSAALGTGASTTLAGTDVSSVGGAQNALAVIDQAIGDVSSHRSSIGTLQNRLDATRSNLGSARENLAAADSRIRDADLANETALLTRDKLLMQAGVAVLAQGNTSAKVALSLLG